MDQHGEHWPLVKAATALLLLLAAPAGAVECRLALLLALDVSSSVDPTEDALQRGGVVAALTSAEVADAFFAADQPVALAVYEWSGRYQQDLILDWTLIDSQNALITAAETVAQSTRGYSNYPTAMGYALGHGARLLERAPSCERHTLDIAGDGQNNEGFSPQQAYRTFPFDGITVNGLVVNAADFEGEVGLIAFYKSEVLHGPGAFLQVANGFADYERAMRRKLVRELMPAVIGGLHETKEPKG